jgi:hypothetical protein
MASTFNELLATVNFYPLDIITLRKTWLKDNPSFLEYVAIPGYRESIKFKHRKDLENLQPDLEHLWLEIPGKNKHSKALIGISTGLPVS